MVKVVAAVRPVPPSALTVPPLSVTVPPTASLSFWPAAFTFTTKVEPAAKLAFPVTLRVVKVVPGVSTPGATVPPDCTVKDFAVPEPPKTPPLTVTSEFAIEPVTASVPAMTLVGPV